MMKRWIVISTVLLITAAIWTWSNQQHSEEAWTELEQAAAAGETIHVALMNQKGEQVGNVHLKQMKDGLDVHVKADRLPAGEHALHVHERGVCETPDFESAGGHFNPTDRIHGFLQEKGPHAGDLPNFMVNASGQADARYMTNLITLEPGKKTSLLSKSGTAIVIHEKADDYFTGPAGDAGARIACGVIAEPK